MLHFHHHCTCVSTLPLPASRHRWWCCRTRISISTLSSKCIDQLFTFFHALTQYIYKPLSSVIELWVHETAFSRLIATVEHQYDVHGILCSGMPADVTWHLMFRECQLKYTRMEWNSRYTPWHAGGTSWELLRSCRCTFVWTFKAFTRYYGSTKAYTLFSYISHNCWNVDLLCKMLFKIRMMLFQYLEMRFRSKPLMMIAYVFGIISPVSKTS